ncbi:sirohydrochlorin chelatase [Nonomuraea sp. CA-218870]|uniref:sirohydrochlorin chelatase n=1 Tax=Nonomuraea sp. CA-218870 TaxID=3239998 RepID=UPI003D8B69FD
MRHSPVTPGRPVPLAGGTGPSVPMVAVAHGSRDPRAAATVAALLDEVRRLRPWLPVRTAYLDHATPALGQALHGLAEAVVLPLLLTEAYHSRVDLPAALREARARDPRLRVRYGTTLGPHPLLMAALERRLEEAGVTVGDPDTAVVLVSAGSGDARANEVIAGLARAWRRPAAAPSFTTRSFTTRPLTTRPLTGCSWPDRSSTDRSLPPRGWWAVEPAYASAASPTPAQAVARLKEAGAPRVVVAPYLLAPGYFADKVRRTALEAGADVVADVLGAAPELAQVLLERYESALRAPADDLRTA